jgi:hypothetical protein
MISTHQAGEKHNIDPQEEDGRHYTSVLKNISMTYIYAVIGRSSWYNTASVPAYPSVFIDARKGTPS